MKDRLPSSPAPILLMFISYSHFFLSFDMFPYKCITLLETLESVHSASLTLHFGNLSTLH